MKVRRAVSNDAEALKELGNDAWTPTWNNALWDEMLKEETGRRIVLVIERDGQLLGFVVASFLLDIAEIENLAVAEHARRQGIARQLLAALAQCAVERSASTIELEVHEHNAAARAFYRSLGFVEQGRRAKYYTHPEGDAVLMQVRAKLLIVQS